MTFYFVNFIDKMETLLEMSRYLLVLMFGVLLIQSKDWICDPIRNSDCGKSYISDGIDAPDCKPKSCGIYVTTVNESLVQLAKSLSSVVFQNLPPDKYAKVIISKLQVQFHWHHKILIIKGKI
jgi:hypothetical protein